MVKIFKGLYINPLTVAFFVLCYLSGKTAFFIISYLSMLVHELGHMVAAMYIGLEPSHISLHPFGVNLKLKNSMVCSILDDIIIYLSGPFVNLLLAIFFAFFYKPRYLYDYGFVVNIMLFMLNTLPVYPLDGGAVLKKIFINFLGEKSGNAIMKILSGIVAALVFGCGIFMVLKTGYNYSCLFISVLMFANIFTSGEKYSQETVKNIIFNDKIFANKTGKPVQVVACTESFAPVKFIKYVRPGVFTCVAVVGTDGNIERFVTERELIDAALNEKEAVYKVSPQSKGME